MNKRLKKFITAMKKRDYKYLCGDETSTLITFVKLFAECKYVDFVIRISVDDFELHNVYAIDNFINKHSIERIEKAIEESRKESEDK